MQEIDLWGMVDIMNDDCTIEEALELTKEQAIIAQNVDPAVMTAEESEIVFPSTPRPKDDDDPAIFAWRTKRKSHDQRW